MMLVGELIEALQQLVAEDEYRVDMRVTFGEDFAVVGNFRIAWDDANLCVLNLTEY